MDGKPSKVMSYPEKNHYETWKNNSEQLGFQNNWDLTRKNNVFYHVLSNLSSKHGDLPDTNWDLPSKQFPEMALG